MEKFKRKKTNSSESSEDPNKGARERSRPEGRVRKLQKNTFKVNSGEIFHIEPEKKDALICKMIELESEYLRIHPPQYLWYDYEPEKESDKEYGFYNREKGRVRYDDGFEMDAEADTIYINSAYPLQTKTDYKEFLDTIIHETRHKYQYESIESIKDHREITETSRQFLEYSDENFDEDFRRGRYSINGLEWDTKAFAEQRTKLYMEYTVDEILSLEKAPAIIVRNQILMEAGSISPNGTIAPITVGKTFDEFIQKNADRKEDEGENNIPKGGFNMASSVDFSEEAQRAAGNKYEEVIADIYKIASDTITEFTGIIEKTPFEQLESAGNIFIEFYNNDLRDKVKKAIEGWRNSDNSFTALLTSIGESQKSINAANKIEEDIQNEVENFEQMDQIKIDKPVAIDVQAIESAAEKFNTFCTKLGELKEEYEKTFNQLADSNALYANMVEMVNTTFSKVEEGAIATRTDMENISTEFKEALGKMNTIATAKATIAKSNVATGQVHQFKEKRTRMTTF